MARKNKKAGPPGRPARRPARREGAERGWRHYRGYRVQR